jgi:putative transposase
MRHAIKFQPGTRFSWDGKTYTVTAIRGGFFEARATDGSTSLIDVASLLSEPGFTFPEWDYTNRIEPTFETIASPQAIADAKKMEQHLLEVITGFPSGHPEMEEGSARDGFDPKTTNVTSRINKKAKELEVVPNTLWVLKREYLIHGFITLIDGRSIRVKSGHGKLDPIIETAMETVLEGLKSKSDVKLGVIRADLTLEVEKIVKESGGQMPKLPSVPTLNRHISRIKKQLKFKISAKQRASHESRPNPPFKWFHANRPGQTILIDSTVLDVFALDPITGEWIRLQLTIAIDLYTRSLVAWRFTQDTKGIDVALLLYDIIRPKQFLPGWPKQARWNFVGIPDSLVITQYENAQAESTETQLAGIPVVYPETVIVDHGKVYRSDTFKRSCLLLGINLQPARIRGPTDKGPVETTFDFIKDNFCALLRGFTGPNVLSRGKDVEEDAIYFVNDIDEMFTDWVASFWQTRVHAGLQFDGAPHVDVSPNDAYAEGLSRAGFVYCVPDSGIYFDCLPTRALAVNHDGINLFGIRYDDPALEPFRQRPAPAAYGHKGKYIIRYDPRSLSTCFFYDFHNGKWLQINWRKHSLQLQQPFNDLTLKYAHSLAVTRYGSKPHAQMVEEILADILRRFRDKIVANEFERRLLVKQMLHSLAAAKDVRSLGASGTEIRLPPTDFAKVIDVDIKLEVDPDEDDDSDDLSLVEGYESKQNV